MPSLLISPRRGCARAAPGWLAGAPQVVEITHGARPQPPLVS